MPEAHPEELVIESEEAERLAIELAALTGEPIGVAVTRALEERLERSRRGVEADKGAIDLEGDLASVPPELSDDDA